MQICWIVLSKSKKGLVIHMYILIIQKFIFGSAESLCVGKSVKVLLISCFSFLWNGDIECLPVSSSKMITHFETRKINLSVNCSNSKNFNARNKVAFNFWPTISTLIISASEPLLTADGDWGLTLGANFKFYTSVTKGSKLKVRKF